MSRPANCFGHIKIARKTFESDPWWLEPRAFSKWEAWVDCLQLAQWKERPIATKYGLVELRRGEFVLAVRTAAKRWGWTKHAADRFLGLLVETGRIAGRSGGRIGTVYRIVKYDIYQTAAVESQTQIRTHPQTPDGRKSDKNKNREAGKEKTSWLAPCASAWESVFGAGSFPYPKAGKALKPLRDAGHDPQTIADSLGRYARSLDDPRFASFPKFAETFARWAPVEEPPLVDADGVLTAYGDKVTRGPGMLPWGAAA